MWLFGKKARTPNGEDLGRRGESAAGSALKRSGMKILARNYRCPAGEIDLIALDRSADGDCIAFVEVKTRSSDEFVLPQSAVGRKKQDHIRRAASYYIHTHPQADRYQLRFDVVSVLVDSDGKAVVTHIPDAF